MSRITMCLVVTGCVGMWVGIAGAGAQGEGSLPTAAGRPIRVLLITGGHDFDRPHFMKLFESLEGITVREVQQPGAKAWFAPEKADQYDVMVWYDMVQEISEQEKQHLVALLQKGKPLVALHHCLANYQNWPEAGKILGGRYWLEARDGRPGSTFREGVDIQVKIAEPRHPITRSLKDFEIHDEVYGKLEVMEGVTPLLTVNHPESSPVVAWTHTYGRSPVVYIQLGHGREAYQNVSFRQLVGQAIRWAAGAVSEQPERSAKEEPVWRLGMQAYTFRVYTFFEAIDKTKALGLRHIESYPGQKLSPDQTDVRWDHNASPEIREKVKAKLKEAGVRLTLYGVVGITNNEAETRKIFDFAKEMGIETITAEPEPAAMDLLDRLTQEYGINIAIHNHPRSPLTRYWNPQTVLDAIKGRNPRIGACADTGHWIRSGLDPIECLKKLEGRIISLHFKDLNAKEPKAHDVPWGTGVANVRGILEELKRQRFSGVFSVEYEHNWENSVPEIAKSLEYFRKVAQELGQRVE